MKFHHIGIATTNINETLNYIKKVYHNIDNITDIIYDELQDANLCMVTLDDGINIELVAGNQVNGYLKKRIYLYHTCWEVDDIDYTVKLHQESGALLISEPKEAILFNNRRIAFVYSDIGLVEFLEKSKI
jgi:methylmalonyl-CoA/ethylmalonyl-CoA epimerase